MKDGTAEMAMGTWKRKEREWLEEKEEREIQTTGNKNKKGAEGEGENVTHAKKGRSLVRSEVSKNGSGMAKAENHPY